MIWVIISITYPSNITIKPKISEENNQIQSKTFNDCIKIMFISTLNFNIKYSLNVIYFFILYEY